MKLSSLAEALVASVEAKRSWDEVRPVACLVKVGFRYSATKVLAIEAFMCFRV